MPQATAGDCMVLLRMWAVEGETLLEETVSLRLRQT